jgi:hypothetical protein
MICPLLSKRTGTDQEECKGENCAWWNDDDEKCAVLNIAIYLNEIAVNTTETI